MDAGAVEIGQLLLLLLHDDGRIDVSARRASPSTGDVAHQHSALLAAGLCAVDVVGHSASVWRSGDLGADAARCGDSAVCRLRARLECRRRRVDDNDAMTTD